MFSIGEFSRLCQVSTKTLRHYDGIGLLKPAYQNGETGYRYYDASQLQEMLFILKLRRYGFALEEIGPLIGADDSRLKAALQTRLNERQAAQREAAAVTEQMKNDIHMLEKGMELMANTIEVKIVEQPEMKLVSVRETIAVKDFDKLFNKLYAKLGQLGIDLSDAPLAMYHSEDFNPEATDVEVGFPTAVESAVNHTLAPAKCAYTVHKGSYSNLNESYAGMAKWIEENGYKIVSAPYEVYVSDPAKTPEDELVTEIYFPIQ